MLQEASVAPDEEAGVARSKLKLYRWKKNWLVGLDDMIMMTDMNAIPLYQQW